VKIPIHCDGIGNILPCASTRTIVVIIRANGINFRILYNAFIKILKK
jgi:hypothetical protein